MSDKPSKFSQQNEHAEERKAEAAKNGAVVNEPKKQEEAAPAPEKTK